MEQEWFRSYRLPHSDRCAYKCAWACFARKGQEVVFFHIFFLTPLFSGLKTKVLNKFSFSGIKILRSTKNLKILEKSQIMKKKPWKILRSEKSLSVIKTPDLTNHQFPPKKIPNLRDGGPLIWKIILGIKNPKSEKIWKVQLVFDCKFFDLPRYLPKNHK